MIDWNSIEGFDWDRGNAAKSVSKHGVSCREAEEIFHNEPLIVRSDPAHSTSEKRLRALGRTDAGRLLHAAFTVRHNLIRVISIRSMNRKERTIYEN
jgi:uncharacterized DUF497 family protein